VAAEEEEAEVVEAEAVEAEVVEAEVVLACHNSLKYLVYIRCPV